MIGGPDILDRRKTGERDAVGDPEPSRKSLENLAHRPFAVESQSPWSLLPLRSGKGREKNVLALGRGMEPADAGEAELASAVEAWPRGEASNATFTGLRTTSAFEIGSPICFSTSRRSASETKKQRRAKGSTLRYRSAISSVRQSSSELACPIPTNGARFR